MALALVMDHLPAALLVLGVLSIVHLYRTWARLRHIPGPFLAKFTNLPRLYWVYKRNAHDTHIALHKKYGKIVRMGPNMVSVGDATEVQNIYKMKGSFQKVGRDKDCVGIH